MNAVLHESPSSKQKFSDSGNLNFVCRGAAIMAAAAMTNGVMQHALSTRESSQGEAVSLVEAVDPDDNFEGIIGRSAAMGALRKHIKIVAPTGSTVLILGETGTGKELIAHAIHNLSSRRDRPFVKVNCAAIPAGLIESELFGHERGAFTGAVGQRTGRFEMANGGTLFLDEIGDIPLELQPKLLRVLQEQEFERVGGTRTMRGNVRIVAATSRDLRNMVLDGEFRADLYYRLNVFPISVPALRERLDDIPLLVRHFVQLYARRMDKSVSDVSIETMEVLSRYLWPGNVRELQNVIERSVILSPGRVLTPPLPELSAVHPAVPDMPHRPTASAHTLKEIERQHILLALRDADWVVGGPNGAAARLGLKRTTLAAKMQKLGIHRPARRNESEPLKHSEHAHVASHLT
jgi:formate hydrogenlyase transcriptional activator